MKIEIIPSPTGEDVLLKMDDTGKAYTRQELHELDWAIRKYLEEQPMRTLREGRGHE